MEKQYNYKEIFEIFTSGRLNVNHTLFRIVFNDRMDENQQEDLLQCLLNESGKEEDPIIFFNKYLTKTELECLAVLNLDEKRLWIYDLTENNNEKGYYENVIDIPLLSAEEENDQ